MRCWCVEESERAKGFGCSPYGSWRRQESCWRSAAALPWSEGAGWHSDSPGRATSKGGRRGRTTPQTSCTRGSASSAWRRDLGSLCTNAGKRFVRVDVVAVRADSVGQASHHVWAAVWGGCFNTPPSLRRGAFGHHRRASCGNARGLARRAAWFIGPVAGIFRLCQPLLPWPAFIGGRGALAGSSFLTWRRGRSSWIVWRSRRRELKPSSSGSTARSASACCRLL